MRQTDTQIVRQIELYGTAEQKAQLAQIKEAHRLTLQESRLRYYANRRFPQTLRQRHNHKYFDIEA